MSSIGDQYEDWFRSGNRDLRVFLDGRDLSDDQFTELLLTDQFLRHSHGEDHHVGHYVKQFERVAADLEMQTNLWLECFGYLEESGPLSKSQREDFVSALPDVIRAKVQEELSLDSHPKDPTGNNGAPVIPRYKVESEIGKGGFGVVYRAWDQQLERHVALKVIHSRESSEGLFAEARVIASLDDPGIVSVFDCGVSPCGRSFIVTSILDGQDLRDWTKNQTLNDWRPTCELIRKLCRSLHR
ncbi:MAG: protein kinase, partial [Planctomycetota bacterium]